MGWSGARGRVETSCTALAWSGRGPGGKGHRGEGALSGPPTVIALCIWPCGYHLSLGSESTTASGSLFRCVWIEKESINSVIVSDTPEDLHQRMLVAASLSVNATGEWGLCSLLVPLPSSPCLHHWRCSVLPLVSTFMHLCDHLSFHMGLISH